MVTANELRDEVIECEESTRGTCLTRQLLLSEVSGCLVEKPECGHAYKFGFSFLCRHPDHTKFNAFAAGILTRNEMHELYSELREKRRDEFLADQDETVRRSFLTQSNFFSQPLSAAD